VPQARSRLQCHVPTADERFYEELEPFDSFVEVPEPEHYRPVPDSWLVVITDVKGSTKAIEAGRYKDVNALGVASIVALRNAVGDIRIPYVFGGDGATLLVPGSRRHQVEPALRGICSMARASFDFDMRAGIVPVGELRKEGYPVFAARYRASAAIDLAMLSGEGLTEAERRVKDPELSYQVGEGAALADFNGFECRWRPIPSRNGEVVSLLVKATTADRDEGAAVYRRIIEKIESAQAEFAPGRPVAPETLQLQRFRDGFDQEARIRSGEARGLVFWFRSLVAKLSAWIGTVLMKRRMNAFGFPGRAYKDEVTANTDFRKFDDMLRMVIDVTPAQHTAIEALLEQEHDEGAIVYGLHSAPTTIMTCAISDYRGGHVHFVDGSDGGYALAAKQLKGMQRDDDALPKTAD
jgi:hypothetical protein